MHSPITQQPGGPLDAPLSEIASRLGATMDQVLLAWTKAMGAVVVTYVIVRRCIIAFSVFTHGCIPRTSSQKTRLQGYLTAGDISTHLSDICQNLFFIYCALMNPRVNAGRH